jgi:hypothetical protein
MPAQLKVVIVAFAALAFANARSAVLTAYRHLDSRWPSYALLGFSAAAALSISIYLILKRRSEARWVSTIVAAAMMTVVITRLIVNLKIDEMVDFSGNPLPREMWVYRTLLVSYVSYGIAFPGGVYLLCSTGRSRKWLQS